MSKLTGAGIEAAIESGSIKIENFSRKNLNPNSYNLALSPKILIYKPRHWYTPWRKPLIWGEGNPPDDEIFMGEDGLLIRPGWFYLGATQEYTETHSYVPILDGRSSGGRMSLHIHATAGFGDLGFCGHWTTEMYSIVPVRVFPGSRICQISYHTIHGEIRDTYHGRYARFSGPVSSLPCASPLPVKPNTDDLFDRDLI